MSLKGRVCCEPLATGAVVSGRRALELAARRHGGHLEVAPISCPPVHVHDGGGPAAARSPWPTSKSAPSGPGPPGEDSLVHGGHLRVPVRSTTWAGPSCRRRCGAGAAVWAGA